MWAIYEYFCKLPTQINIDPLKYKKSEKNDERGLFLGENNEIYDKPKLVALFSNQDAQEIGLSEDVDIGYLSANEQGIFLLFRKRLSKQRSTQDTIYFFRKKESGNIKPSLNPPFLDSPPKTVCQNQVTGPVFSTNSH